jgi:hypothetical protein
MKLLAGPMRIGVDDATVIDMIRSAGASSEVAAGGRTPLSRPC